MTLDIVSTKIIEHNEFVRLNRLQKLVCKLFKITPQKEHRYKAELKLAPYFYNYIRPNDVLRNIMGELWLVIAKQDDTLTVTIHSFNQLPYALGSVGDKMKVIGSTYSEGRYEISKNLPKKANT